MSENAIEQVPVHFSYEWHRYEEPVDYAMLRFQQIVSRETEE